MDIGKITKANMKQEFIKIQKGLKEDKVPLYPNIINNSLDNDILNISDEAKGLFEEESNNMKEMLDQLQEATDSSNNPLDNYFKCLKIARRIMNGDNVPDTDKRFLVKNEPDMYSRALLLKRNNKDPKDYDSLLEDEKEDYDTTNESPDISIEDFSGDISEDSVSEE